MYGKTSIVLVLWNSLGVIIDNVTFLRTEKCLLWIEKCQAEENTKHTRSPSVFRTKFKTWWLLVFHTLPMSMLACNYHIYIHNMITLYPRCAEYLFFRYLYIKRIKVKRKTKEYNIYSLFSLHLFLLQKIKTKNVITYMYMYLVLICNNTK